MMEIRNVGGCMLWRELKADHTYEIFIFVCDVYQLVREIFLVILIGEKRLVKEVNLPNIVDHTFSKVGENLQM